MKFDKKMNIAMGILTLIGLIIFPFVLIVSMNTLIPALAIPINFYTWVSSLFIVVLFARP